MPNIEMPRMIWSISLFCFAAHNTPSRREKTMISASVSSSNRNVVGKYAARSSETGFLVNTDSPKSPCNAPVIQVR